MKKFYNKRFEEKMSFKSIEVFAGAGGLALGLEMAGFEHLGLVEFDKWAANTLSTNRPDWNVLCEDIEEVAKRDLEKEFGIKKGELDLLSGGAPCQSFSYAGKRLGLKDIRGTMFYHYAEFLNQLQPKMFLFENVRGLLTHDKGRTFKVICDIFEEQGYEIEYKVLNAWNYGVAQKRERLIVVGIRKDLKDLKFDFPVPHEYKPVLRDILKDVPKSDCASYSEKKAEIFAESGVLVTPQLHMDDNGIMVIQNERKSINWKIFKIFKTLRMLRDFDYCAKRCREFLREYEAEVYKLQDLNFDYMDLAACKDFMHYSYELGQKISYNRFKYAIFPSVLNRSLKAAIRKVDINYTSFDLYWGLDNRTSLVAKEIKEIAAYIRGNVGLKEAILSGVGYDELCEDFIDFQKLTSRFLDRHGFKSDYNCYCVEGKTFIENPDRMLRILKPSISVEEDTGSETFERDFTEITNALKRIYGKKYARLESRIRHFRYFHFVREEGQYLSEIIYFHIRKCLKRINEILLQSSDYKSGIVNLFYEELIQVLTQGALSDSALQKIKRRNEMYPLAEQVWNASKLLIYDEKGDVLSGVSGNAGIAIGKVCVVRSPKEFYKVQRGDILVCPFTTPEWTTLFKLAGAVVADTGSALSHAAIVAREFGIPAVLGVGYATAKLKDGDMVRVDGNKGEVKGYWHE